VGPAEVGEQKEEGLCRESCSDAATATILCRWQR